MPSRSGLRDMNDSGVLSQNMTSLQHLLKELLHKILHIIVFLTTLTQKVAYFEFILLSILNLKM